LIEHAADLAEVDGDGRPQRPPPPHDHFPMFRLVTFQLFGCVGNCAPYPGADGCTSRSIDDAGHGDEYYDEAIE